MLTSDSQVPGVSKTSVGSHLLESLKVVSELGLEVVSENVLVLTVGELLLSVEEPGWDLVLGWVLHDSDDSLKLFLGELTSSLGEVDIGLLANKVRVSSTDTSDGGEGVHDLDSTVNVGVEETVGC